MKIRRMLLAIGLLALPLVLVTVPSVPAAEATAESRTVTIGVPDMH